MLDSEIHNRNSKVPIFWRKKTHPEEDFKEFEPRLKLGQVPLKIVYSVFKYFSRRLIGTGFWQINDAVFIL